MRPAAGAAAALALTISGIGTAAAADDAGQAERPGQDANRPDAAAKAKQRKPQHFGQQAGRGGDRRPTFADHRRDQGLDATNEAQLGTDVNGTLFFTSFESGSGRELWKSDGTAAGTVLVKDVNPGYENSSIR